MKQRISFSRRVFIVCNTFILVLLAVSCLMPFLNLLAVSLSGSTAVASGSVGFWPVDFTLSSYKFVMKSKAFITSFVISLQRVGLGTAINLLLSILTAYALSREKKDFKMRGFYSWFFIFTMVFSGGLIPWYMVIKYTGLIDSIWALILPGALPVFSMIVLLNFFRGIPKELEEAAFIDGAGHMTTLWKIYVPLSKPSIATITLFALLNHWNSWFDGLILMNRPEHYPLQTYLQTIIVNPEAYFKNMTVRSDVSALLGMVNNKTAKAAQLFVAILPILVVYPFLQKYFTTGLVMGSVKG